LASRLITVVSVCCLAFGLMMGTMGWGGGKTLFTGTPVSFLL
jgi:hypothetical protein